LSASAELLVIFGPFGLKLYIHAHFCGVLGDMTGFPLDMGNSARGSNTTVLGRKSFNTGLAILTSFHSKYRAS